MSVLSVATEENGGCMLTTHPSYNGFVTRLPELSVEAGLQCQLMEHV